METVITKKEALRALGYKIKADYQKETAKNAAYWANVDLRLKKLQAAVMSWRLVVCKKDPRTLADPGLLSILTVARGHPSAVPQ